MCPTFPRNKNPFKKSETDDKDSQSEDNSESSKGLSFIDAWRKPPEKSVVAEFNPKHPQGKKATTTKKKADKELTSNASTNKKVNYLVSVIICNHSISN